MGCISSFQCLFETAKIVPAINQIKMHVGMGVDPWGLVSYGHSKGIVSQAYSSLGDGEMVTSIGKAHNVTGAQVSLRWFVEHGIAFTTKTSEASHLQQDLGVFAFQLEDAELTKLDSATKPPGQPSWACTDGMQMPLIV